MKKPHNKKYSNRFPDEALLMMLKMRDEGWSYSEMSRYFRVNHNYISKALREVNEDYKRSESA